MDFEPRVVASDNNLCGEAPIWDAQRRLVLWTDLPQRLLYELSPSTGITRVAHLRCMVSGIAQDSAGGLVLAGPDGLHAWNAENDERELLTSHAGEELSFNDVVADPHGRLYAGTIYLSPDGIDVEKSGKLYLVGPGPTVRVVDEGFLMSNGLSLSPDNRTLYHADTAARCIYSYSVEPDSGDLHNRRQFVRIPVSEGVPDGITVDAEGFVWCAHWFGGRVVRYDPDGAVERNINLPVTQVSSLAFGGESLSELYVTTASEQWDSPLRPRACTSSSGGSLYCVRVDVQGKPEHHANVVAPSHDRP